MKLLPRIVVSVILPMLALAGVALYGGSLLMQSSLLEEQQERAQATLAQSVGRLQLSLGEARDAVRLMAHSDPLAGADLAQIEPALRRWQGASERFESFRFLALHELAASTETALPKLPAELPAELLAALRAGQQAVSAPSINAASGELIMGIATPVFDQRGRQVGALLANLKLEQLLSIPIGNAAQRDARLMVLDAQSRLLAGGLGEEGQALSPVDAASQPQAFAVMASLASKEHAAELSRIAVSHAGTQVIWQALTKRVPELDWQVIYAMPEQSLFERAAKFQQRGLLGLGICALLALAGAALMRHVVLRPLMQLQLAQQRLQAGDSHARASVSGDDEISELARSFNLMAETLDATEQRFRMIFEAFPHPITLASFQDGNYVDVNPAFAAALGIAQQEAIGRSPIDFGLVASMEDLLVKGQELAQTGSLAPELLQTQNAQGEALWLTYSTRLIGSGQDKLVLAVATDITELKTAEAQLRQSEQSLTALFEFAPLPMARTRLTAGSDSPTFWNQAWYRAFGYAPGSCDGMPSTRFDFWVDPAERSRFVDEMVRNEFALNRQAQLRHADGSVRQCEVSGRYIDVGGERTVLASYLDVTEKIRITAELNQLNTRLEARVAERTSELARRNQELDEALSVLKHTQAELVRTEKLSSLGSLVAGIAHELNTPIGNAMLMATTLAARQTEFETAVAEGLRRSVLQEFLRGLREACTMLEASLGRAAELISSFKQVAVDQSSYQLRDFDLQEVLHETALSLGPSLKLSGTSLVEDVPAGLLMHSYPGPLIQVFMNIVNNAVLHAFEPGQAGCVRIKARALGEERVLIELSDDGRGMPSEHLQRAFDPFFTTKLGQGGSGLGLHIVYNLVTGLLGGQVRLSSDSGQGTRLSIELPLRAPQEPS
ncbi:PAS domain S-box protein [Roseateles oligotrophus]|uniref:histidine kinase n=1 Tax=Roseateles oligotrophus TaxID=1769250 RepID=A0ABT2YJG1_9BURK|nr:PAS domain S-box protein [Roseateles oligotrophus]MCV2370204.1 PAS domain S-box protein [Roseateles oligotrophus]